MDFSTRIKDALMRRIGEGARMSYSQSGEDILIAKALGSLNISRPRYLDIGVSCPSGGVFTPLSTRQQVTAAPFALYAIQAGSVTGIVGTATGGTGITSSGSAGNYLRSNGSNWTSSAMSRRPLKPVSRQASQPAGWKWPEASFFLHLSQSRRTSLWLTTAAMLDVTW